MALDKVRVLRDMPLMGELSLDAVERLARVAVERSFLPGQAIVQEGTVGRDVYLIVEGKVEVVKGEGTEETLLAHRGPGDLFGEMAFIEGKARFATIRATQPVLLLEFSERELNSAMAEQPEFLYEVIRMLSARLRESELQMIVDLQHKNEELAKAYQELQEAQASLIEKEKMEHELELARKIQQSMLPQSFPHVPGFSCAASSRPARHVGGDFYDVIPLSGNRVGLVIADVSDKGIAAALYMALGRSLVRVEARRSASPRQVLSSLNRLLLEISQAGMFVTVFYGVLDPAQGTLRYARGGHDLPLLIRHGGEVTRLDAPGTLLGFMDTVSLTEGTVEMGPGDLLVLYTDGITDAHAPGGETFGQDRLRQAARMAIEWTPQQVCDSILQQIAEFQQGAAQFDDMTLLVARVEQGGCRED